MPWNPKDDPNIHIDSPEDLLEKEKKRRTRFIRLITVMIVIVALSFGSAVYMTINQGNSNQSQVTQIKEARTESRTGLCNLLGSQAIQINNQTDTINSIIITNVKSSKPFEKVYTQLGLPSYNERLEQAQSITKRLNAHKVAIIDCKIYIETGKIVPAANSPVQTIPKLVK